MTIDCKTPRNDQEKSLCACLQATDAYSRLIGIYEDALEEYAFSSASYQRWKTIHDRWKAKTNEYSRFRGRWGNWGKPDSFRSNERGMSRCGYRSDSWDDWDDHCREHDFRFSVDRNDDAWTYCAFLCRKDASAVESEKKEYSHAEPVADPENLNKVWKGMQVPSKPVYPPGSNILCCSQIFTDINIGNDANFENINQECRMKIQKELDSKDGSDGSDGPGGPDGPGGFLGAVDGTWQLVWLLVLLLITTVIFFIL